ncbi:MAG: NAD/NADP octopine/nopaline dehydrogenase family protein [Ardenticatenia bacterium]|nr:NAD/NADP octopine/nopaline dehydrogenase family protein [Ardenticatenia bacterium]
MKRKAAVLGGGVCGQMFAADLSLAGWEAHLYELPDFGKDIEGVIASRKIEIVGNQLNSRGLTASDIPDTDEVTTEVMEEVLQKTFRRGGIADIDVVTTDMAEALEGVDLINVCVPAVGHKAFFQNMIPHLRDGHIVSIFPDNFGSLVLRKMLRQQNVDAKIVIGGWDTMPGAFRLMKPGKVDCVCRAVELRGDTLPSKDWQDFWNVMKDSPLFDPAEIAHGDTVIDIGLSNPNPVVHCVGTLLSIGAMENAPPESFDLYRDGLSPSIANAMIAFYHEECRVARALGVGIAPHEDNDFRSRTNIMVEHYIGKELRIGFDESWPVENPTGPFDVESRYLTEDIPMGTGARYSLARYLSLEVPVIESVIRLTSAVCGRDFMNECRSMEEMGLGGMSRDEILMYLREGRI